MSNKDYVFWSKTIDGVPIEEHRKQQREVNQLYKQILENIMAKKQAKKKAATKRIRAKVRKPYEMYQYHVGPQGPQGIQGPQGPVGCVGIKKGEDGVAAYHWLNYDQIREAGLYVMHNEQSKSMQVVRLFIVDDGIELKQHATYVIGSGLEGIQVHSAVHHTSAFQKIKE